jgi:hypothetical protein
MNIQNFLQKNNIKSPYLRYAKNIYSQFGDDGIVEQLLNELLPKPLDISRGLNKSRKIYQNKRRHRKYCYCKKKNKRKILNNPRGMVVEFGAWDGIYISNTYQLWRYENFNALLIESDIDRYNQLYKLSKKFKNVEPIHAAVSPDPAHENSMENIIRASKFDFHSNDSENYIMLCIDVDSCDYRIFETLFEFRPFLLLIEIAGGWKPEEEYVGTGASLQSLVKLAEKKQYTLVCATGNAYFVRNDKLHLLKHYDRFLSINDYHLDDKITNDVLAKIDENGNIGKEIYYLTGNYNMFIHHEKTT